MGDTKTMMSRRKRLVVVTTTALICAVVAVSTTPILLKFPMGTARIVGLPRSARILVDGKVSPTAHVYAEAKRFDGTPTDRLLLWLPGGTLGRIVIVIDQTRSTVSMPNAGVDDYDRLCTCLLQSESGDMVVDVTSEKAWPDHDLRLKKSELVIEFVLPRADWIPGEMIRIELAQKERTSKR